MQRSFLTEFLFLRKKAKINLLKGKMIGNDETQDTFYHGRISILQRKKGFRFSLDAPLLADFIRTKQSDELETGLFPCF